MRLSWGLPLLSGVLMGGCVFFASAPPEHVSLRPSPSRLPTYTVSGRAIIATPGPISVSVRPVGPEEVQSYFRARPTRVDPFQGNLDKVTPFLVRIENESRRQQVTFDPSLVILKDERNRSLPAWDEADLYQTFGESPGLLRAAQGAVLARYLVIPAEQSREGLLVFHVFHKDAKAVFLQFTSLYAGSKPYPLIFQFAVIPEESKK